MKKEDNTAKVEALKAKHKEMSEWFSSLQREKDTLAAVEHIFDVFGGEMSLQEALEAQIGYVREFEEEIIQQS